MYRDEDLVAKVIAAHAEQRQAVLIADICRADLLLEVENVARRVLGSNL